jgi:hypothetical protein
MALAESWHVRTRSRECASTHRPFEEGETIVTALYPDPESSGYLRRDFALDAWGSLPGDSEPAFSFWRSLYRAPEAVPERPEERISAEELLRRLVDEDAEHSENTRYILAVMLERQKLLRETDCQRTGSAILRVYEHRKSGEVFLIRDPDIPLAEVERVQAEVIVLLENNGKLPHAAAGSPEVEDSPSAHEAAGSGEAPGDDAARGCDS